VLAASPTRGVPSSTTARSCSSRSTELRAAGAGGFGRRPGAAPSYLATIALPDTPSASWGEFWIEGRVHGDLWSGNVHIDQDGAPWLVDPAAHGGHRETDLAMLALFGFDDLPRCSLHTRRSRRSRTVGASESPRYAAPSPPTSASHPGDLDG
jgi:hypothetical protein